MRRLKSYLAFSCCKPEKNVKSDFRSNEVAYRVYNYILENTGRCPSIIVSMPHRRWLDVNRNDSDGLATFGEEEMKKVYTQYHDGLTELVADVGGRPGILFDIHGHAKKKDWTMIGRLIYKELILWKQLKTFKGRQNGLYCAISGNELSPVALFKLATKARLLYCNFEKLPNKSKTGSNNLNIA